MFGKETPSFERWLPPNQVQLAAPTTPGIERIFWR